MAMEPSSPNPDPLQAGPPAMRSSTVEELKKEILDLLRRGDVDEVVLVGVPGAGKTRMAREISQQAVHDGICFLALWLSMRVKHASLFTSIAHQLGLSSEIKELIDYDIDEEEAELEKLKQEIKATLHELGQRGNGRHLLLVIDDEGSKNEEAGEFLSEFKAMLDNHHVLKCIKTRRSKPGGRPSSAEDQGTQVAVTKEIGPMSKDESLALFKSIVESEFCEYFVERSVGSPASIILIAEALHRSKGLASEVWSPKIAGEEAAVSEDSAKHVTSTVQYAYDMLPGGVIRDCFWHCQEFFRRYDSVNYNDLIIHWILEGCFGEANHVEKAYEDGFGVLMELIDRGILKIQEDDIVLMEDSAFSVTDCERDGFAGIAKLGLTSVVQEEIQRGFGRVTPADGMIKSAKKWKHVSTLLIDGSRLSREIVGEFFHRMQGLKYLALFHPMLKLLTPLSRAENLYLLVLRGCDQLGDVTAIQNLKFLSVLEVTDTSSLRMIPDNFFQQLLQLQSLNFSGTQIKNLPPTLSDLKELRYLLLRNCHSVENLPQLGLLKKLEVLDISGSVSFKRFQEKSFRMFLELHTLDLSWTMVERLPIVSNLKKLTRLFLKGCKNLTRLPKLQKLPGLHVLDISDAESLYEINYDSLEQTGSLKVLDLSNTALDHFPSNTVGVSELYLRHCPKLKDLSGIENIEGLKVLDVSGSDDLVHMGDKLFDNLTVLHQLNLSNTGIKTLPSLSNLHHLKQLLLSGCLSLEEVPPMEVLLKLEILDLSGCAAFVKQSFEHMSCLKKLNLSGTRIETLTSLCSGHLTHLVLRNCANLKNLPALENFTELEELDLDGASSLGEFNLFVLKDVTQLRTLFLSHVALREVKYVSNLTSLRQLSLKKCSGLASEEAIQFPTGLEVLDLSGTDVGDLSPVAHLSELRKLLLGGCANMTELPSLELLKHLEKLDLSKTGVMRFPYEISEMTHLRCLDLREVKFNEQVDWQRIKRLPQKLHWSPLHVSNSVGILPYAKKPSVLINGAAFFWYLQEEPELRESYLKSTYFSVCAPRKEGNGDQQLLERELLISDIYYQIRNFSDYKEKGMSMEVCGYRNDEFPSGLKQALNDAEYVSSVNNQTVTRLSDLGGGKLQKMKGCWLERCMELKILASDASDAKVAESLETLWVSNIPKMKSLCTEELDSPSFINLTQLYIDCCPMLESVFPLHCTLENLESIQIQFCDKLEAVFESREDGKPVLNKLKTIRLLQLPELTTIGALTPNLKRLQVRKCPKLKDQEEGLKSSETEIEITETAAIPSLLSTTAPTEDGTTNI